MKLSLTGSEKDTCEAGDQKLCETGMEDYEETCRSSGGLKIARENWPVGHVGLLKIAGEGGFLVRKVSWECSENLQRLRKGLLSLLSGQVPSSPSPL